MQSLIRRAIRRPMRSLRFRRFAEGDYRAAAAEAHALASISGVPSWDQIYGLYGDVDRYASNLRSLEDFAKQHPKDTDAHFLLGMLYLATGYRAEAEEHLATVADLMPHDKIAQNLLSEAGGRNSETASRVDRDRSDANRSDGGAVRDGHFNAESTDRDRSFNGPPSVPEPPQGAPPAAPSER